MLKGLAEDILNDERNFRDGSGFWWSLHRKEDKAQDEVDELNKVLEGTGSLAMIQIARNYNFYGIEYGVIIDKFTKKSAEILKKKYAIKGS